MTTRNDMPAGQLPKYARLEIERRWRVDLSKVGSLENVQFTEIDDLYVAGTRLRLRNVRGPDQAVEYKLCKKYGEVEAWSEPITNLYLSAAEHALLSTLPGSRVRKRRYALCGGSLDVYESGQVIFEIEFESLDSAKAYAPPAFAGEEVDGVRGSP